MFNELNMCTIIRRQILFSMSLCLNDRLKRKTVAFDHLKIKVDDRGSYEENSIYFPIVVLNEDNVF